MKKVGELGVKPKSPRKRFRGVQKHGKKYRADIMHKRKRIYLGLFETRQEAAAAYRRARSILKPAL